MTVLKSKTIDRLCCLALAVMLALTAAVWAGKAAAGRQKTVAVGYEGLFDQRAVHTIDIEMADWEGFIANATREEYAECAVTIDGTKLAGVGIRAKGNTSLSSVAGLGSQKYSFKIEFDHFVKGRLYQGLDKLSLNNLIYDATMMKDYLAYTLMGKMEVPSPLCSYAQITVNGEPWGLYLAVEGVEDGFLERNNLTAGELYKPDSMSFGGGRGNGRDFDFEEFRQNIEQQLEEGEASDAASDFAASFGGQAGDFAASGGQSADGFGASGGQSAEDSSGSSGQSAEDFAASSGQSAEDFSASFGGQAQQGEDAAAGEARQRGGFGGFGMGSSDVKLQYIDDDPDSYANIFDNAKTKVSKKDKARLISALETLGGEEPREAVFADEVIRYLAVHDFLQNDDSYTGMIVHNYYLYEENGRLAILPWDYNLAFGAQSMGMGGGSAASLVNSPIDSPVTNGDGSDRPLVSWILQDADALAQYHAVYDQFVSEIIESGWLKAEIDRVAALIRPCVEADANSFYTAEEFDAGIDALQTYCALRGESIRGQLNGTIPSTSAGQQADSSALVDGSGLSVSAMGAMSMGGNREGGGFGLPGGFAMPGAENGADDKNALGSQGRRSDTGGSFGGSSGGQSAQDVTPDPDGTPAPEQGAEDPSGGQPSDAKNASGGQPAGTPPPADTVQPETAAPEQPQETGQPEAAPAANGGPSALNDRSGGFPFGQDTSSRMPWWQLGVFAAVLLLAILLAARAPGHEH